MKKPFRIPEIVVIFFVVTVLMVFFGYIAESSAECEDEGGKLVRGTFWFECVKGQP